MSFLQVVRRPGIEMHKENSKEAEGSDLEEDGGLGNFNGPSLHRTMKKLAKAVRINSIRTLESNGVFIVTTKVLKQKKTTEIQ